MMNGGLVGQFFWFDEANGKMRDYFKGTVKAELGLGYYLIEFAPYNELAEGTREVVHVSRMADERWSFFAEAGQLMKAVDGAAR